MPLNYQKILIKSKRKKRCFSSFSVFNSEDFDMNEKPAIYIHNLTKDYGAGKGIFNINLKINKGEVFGFLGPNGAGKTTAIRQLMGFVKPDKGNAEIYGFDCFRQSHHIKKVLGYLPGEPAFFDDMTALDFLGFMADMVKVKDRNYIKTLSDYFELEKSKVKIKKLSKGTKQKIGLICAFMNNPEIIVLDEPSSGLDPLMQIKFIELVLSEKAKGKTIFISSHIFDEIEKTCDRAAIIKHGKIVCIEDIKNLKSVRRKNFSIKFTDADNASKFAEKIEGVYQNGQVVKYTVTGNVDSFIKSMSMYSVEDIEITVPGLDEMFMHYYSDKNADKMETK